MLANPDHKIIKSMAVNLLMNMDHTPDGPQKVCSESMPIAVYFNGLKRPNNKPPESVRLELDGCLWVFSKSKRRWQRN